jgi:hypothetical protein
MSTNHRLAESLWEPGISPASGSHQRNMYQSKQALQAASSWLEHYETVFSSHKVVGFPSDSSSLCAHLIGRKMRPSPPGASGCLSTAGGYSTKATFPFP